MPDPTTTSTDSIRMATASDAEQLLAIYEPYVRDTVISFESDPPTIVEFKGRIVSVLENSPWLVCERDEAIVGYAYATRHNERQAYDWSCNVSVYIDRSFHRLGIGRALYLALFERLTAQGYCNAFAGITLPNEKSIGLHRTLGFSQVAHYKAVGFKFNQWHDVGWYQKQLAEYAVPPLPVRPPAEMGWR